MPRANGARVARNLGRFVQIGAPGVADRVDFGNHASYKIGSSDVVGSAGSAIFCCRFRTSTTAANRVPFLIYSGNNWIYFPILSTAGSAQQAIRVEFVRAGVQIAIATLGNYTEDKVHVIAITWDATGAAAYIDGVQVWTKAIDVRPTFAATPLFILGNSISPYSNAFNGDVGGEAYLYSRKLSKGEIEQHYFDGEVPSAPVSAWGPTGWPATGTTVALTGGSGNNGTITSGTLMNEPAEQKPALATRQRVGSRFQQNLPSASMGGWAVADHATLKPVNFSVEARVRLDAWAAGTLGAGSLPASNTRGLVVKTTGLLWNDGWGLVEVAGSTGLRTIRLFISSYLTGASFTVAPNTKEVHVLATHDGTTARLYVDGELVGSSAVALTQVATSLRIGCGYDTGAAAGYSHEGSIRDVRYYSRVLSAVEARARFQDNLDIESGLIAAWDLSESRRQSAYNVFVGVVAKDRVGGFDAVWTRGANNSDAEDIGSRRAPRRKNVERVNIPWLSGSAMSALDASMVIGTGSFSAVGTFRIHSWNANVNNLIVATDNATYANGWFLSYTAVSEATLALTGYLGSGGPNVNGTTSGRVTVQRGKTFRLAFVADATTQKCSWYIDGVRLSEVTIAAWNLPNTPRFAVGRHNGIAAATGCQAADVRYAVGRAWTKEEIEADANGVDDALSGVTHAWPMDDAPGVTTLRATKGSSPLLLANGAAVGQLAIANDYTEAPRTQNGITYSEQFNNAAWTKAAGVTCTDNSVIAPDGSLTACAVDATAAGANTGMSQAVAVAARTAPGNDACRSIWVKGTAGQTVSITDPVSSNTTTTVTFDGTWQRVSNLDPVLFATGSYGIWIRKGTASTWSQWGAQVNNAKSLALSTYVKTEGGVVIGPTDISSYNEQSWVPTVDLAAWYDPRQLVTLNGTDVSALGNRGTESRSISQATPANQPAYVSAGGVFGGPEYPHIAFTSANNDRLESAASWSFLHDGTGMCIAVRYRATPTGGHLIDTCNASPANVGITLLHDGAGARAQIVIANGSGAYLANLQTNASSVANDTAHTLIAWWKKGAPREVGIAVDGVVLSTVAASLAPSAAAPSFNMGVGRRASAANALQGEIGQLVLLRTAPDSVMIARLHQFLVTPPG